MTELALSPYFHPTTTVFVDDNETFLESLVLDAPAGGACRLFADPLEALAYLEQPPVLPALIDRCFSMQRPSGGGAVVHLDLSMIEQEINHVDRFRRNSVAIVDFAMPQLNGLDLCAAISDRQIRKAMLTGVADEKDAVAAFNTGLIHRFIPKQEAAAVDVLHAFIAELQHEYFSQYSARLRDTLAIDPPPFLLEPAIATHVEALMREHRLVEYYLVDEPPGLILLESNGTPFRLIALTDTELRAQSELAQACGAPSEVAAGLASGRLVACFDGELPEEHFGPEPYPWLEKVIPATRVAGRGGAFHLGLVENAITDIDFDPARASYDAYLATL